MTNHRPPYSCVKSEIRVGSADLFAVRQEFFLPGFPHLQATQRVACLSTELG